MPGRRITGPTIKARRDAQRYRGFPLTWDVSPHWRAGACEARPLQRGKMRAGHQRAFMIDVGPYSPLITGCVNCLPFQKAQAIRWAEKHGDHAEAFRN